MTQFALEITDLKKTYDSGAIALKGINLAVEEGDFFALLGPNGAGKSSTIGIIASLVTKSSGKVKIYEIHGSNNQLQLSPVECLDIQDSFINSFQKKNTELFQTEVKQFPNKLKSKTTWEIYLSNKSNSNELIFSVTCDYSFNNRRMDIILSDSTYLSDENSNYENLLDENKENISKEEIDTSGI